MFTWTWTNTQILRYSYRSVQLFIRNVLICDVIDTILNDSLQLLSQSSR